MGNEKKRRRKTRSEVKLHRVTRGFEGARDRRATIGAPGGARAHAQRAEAKQMRIARGKLGAWVAHLRARVFF